MSVITATITDNEENIQVTITTGGGGGKTNLSYIASPADGIVVSSTGTDATIPAATELNAGLFLPTEKTKLAGIVAGAEPNVNADWNAVSGNALILNKPIFGTAAFSNTGDFATAAQGAKADSALQPGNIGVTVQGYSVVLTNTTASFTAADEAKLDGIAAGAEVNVNADWNAIAGNALILNKPALGSAAAANVGDFATASQGAKADSALQPGTIGVTVQGYSSVLANTTASFTTADETKLDGIEVGAEVNNISDANATDLTDGGDTTLHTHDGRYYTEAETDALIANAFSSIQIDQSGGVSDTYGTLIGSVNDSNTDFMVSLGSYPSGKLKVYLNGQLQTQGTTEDWTELNAATGTFRFVTAPLSGDLITVEYGKTQNVAGTIDSGNVNGLNALLATKINKAGDTGIGSLVFNAGGTAPGTAPIKLTSQPTPLAVVEQGTFELVGNGLQFSQFLKRRGVVMSENIRTSDLTIANTVTESGAISTVEHGANYLEVGKCEEITIKGFISQRNNAAAFGSFRIKYAGVTVQTLVTPASVTMTNVPFELKVTLTCRSTGVSGTARIDSLIQFGASVAADPGSGGVAVINTTVEQPTTVTFQWNEANAANTVTFTQGYVLCIEPNR
jgi:Cu/Ag efflux protein CusF